MDLSLFLTALSAGLAGTVLAALLGCLPALHVYNVAGIVIILFSYVRDSLGLPDAAFASFMMGLVVGYSMVSTLPAIFLGTPDEAAMFMTLPGQKYLMQGRGYEAVMLTAVGGLGAVAFFGLCSPFFLTLLGPFKQLVAPHSFWFLALMLVFMVMSEWPKGGDRGRPGQRFLDAWSSLFAGQATLLLSGLLGFIILYKPIVPPRFAFQNIMPAFVGLYAVPWIITNIISRMPLPRQVIPKSIDAPQPVLLRATAAGVGGGMIAALFPLITGGMGGLIAGHATAQKDERAFVISQGASKMVYYVGAFFLLFVPGLARTRGGMAWMVQSFYTPSTFQDYWMIVATILICGGASFLMLILLTRGMLWLIQKVDHRLLSAFTAVLVLVVVYAITSWQGILVMIVSTGIGMIPVFFHSRRMNCMGVLLIPVTLNMAGLGPAVADFLGLMS